ncbi:MAG: SBBP repeat-containing protein, partial [Chitinophagaceae bacterium]
NCNLAGTNLITTFDQISTNKNQYFLVKFSSNGDVRWLRQATNHTATGGTLCLDNKGNVYTTLSFQSLLQIDTTLLTQSNNRTAQAICKYDSLGNVKLVKKISNPTTGGVSFRNIICDTSGNNILVIGNTVGDVKIDSLTINTATTQILLAKFTTDSLKIKFVKVANNPNNVYPEEFHVSKNNNIYFSFLVEGVSANLFDRIVNFKANTFRNVAFAQADTLGNINWIKSIDGNQSDYITSIASDSFNNVFICGSTNYTFVQPNTITGAGTNIGGAISKGNLFFASFDAVGNLRFLKSGTDAIPSSIALDSVGNCYMTGTFNYNQNFDNIYVQGSSAQVGLNDFFISKIKSSDFINPI